MVSAAGALCLNIFVGVVQAFLKVPPLNAIAPNQTEWPFLVTQLIVVTLFVVLAIVAVLRFRKPTDDCGHSRPRSHCYGSCPDVSNDHH